MSIFFHNFNVSVYHEVRNLVLPGLLRSTSSPPNVRCPLVNLFRPTTVFDSMEVSIPFQLPSLNSLYIFFVACNLPLIVVFEIFFCNQDTLAELNKIELDYLDQGLLEITGSAGLMQPSEAVSPK